MRGLDDLPPRVTIYEVGPRDGLQNESVVVPTDVKVRFIDLLAAAGLPVIEVTSLVRPDSIPQLADAEAVLRDVNRRAGTMYTALVPNMKGMDRVVPGTLGGIALFTAVSETFSRRNTNASIAETLDRFRPVAERARADRLWIRGYVSTAFGCPFEGAVAAEAVAEVAGALAALGVGEIAISDTIGVATPADVLRVIRAVERVADLSRLALHFHDTRGTALANVLAGLQLGITTYDSAAGGLGGCPYAPGASGNLATEDLVYLLDGLGIQTGVSLDGVAAASDYLTTATGHAPIRRGRREATA